MKHILGFQDFINESLEKGISYVYEATTKYTEKDFPIGAVVHMGDEEWKVVKPGARYGKIFMVPFNKTAKDRHVSTAIEFPLSDLDKDVDKIEK